MGKILEKKEVGGPGRERRLSSLTLPNIIQGVLGAIAWPASTTFFQTKMGYKNVLGLKNALLGPSLASAWPQWGACLAAVLVTNRGPNRITSAQLLAVFPTLCPPLWYPIEH